MKFQLYLFPLCELMLFITLFAEQNIVQYLRIFYLNQNTTHSSDAISNTEMHLDATRNSRKLQSARY